MVPFVWSLIYNEFRLQDVPFEQTLNFAYP